MTKRTRLKIATFSAIVFIIVGIGAFVYSPENIEGLSVYMAVTTVPIVTYIISETIRKS